MESRFDTIRKYKTLSGKEYYSNVIYPEIELSEDDIYVIATEGDRYDTLAYQFYRNIDYWWIIASANNANTDSLVISPGTQIRIPANPSKCYTEFIELNR